MENVLVDMFQTSTLYKDCMYNNQVFFTTKTLKLNWGRTEFLFKLSLSIFCVIKTVRVLESYNTFFNRYSHILIHLHPPSMIREHLAL